MMYETDYRTYNVSAYRRCYSNDNLAIELTADDIGETFGVLTVNLGKLEDKTLAYVDTDNLKRAEEFIKKYNLGEPTGKTKQSGYCEYPLYKFDLTKLRESEDYE